MKQLMISWRELMADPSYTPGDYADMLPISTTAKRKYKVARLIRDAMASAESEGSYLNPGQIAARTGLSIRTVSRYLKMMTTDVMPYLTHSRKYRLTARGHNTQRSQRR